MANGKTTCKILKELRRRIAEANDINLLIEECTYKGDCLGTCPKCEAEVRYLEHQLQLRRATGKAVAIAGISAGMMMLSCCSLSAKNVAESSFSETVDIVDAVDVTDLDTAWSDITTEKISSDTSSMLNDVYVGGECPPEPEETVIPDENPVLTGYSLEEIIIIETDSIQPTDPDKIFDVVEKKPSFPGGDRCLLNYISENLVFPDSVDESIVGGRVVVKFVVMKDGSIGEVKVVRSKGEKFDNEAVRVVKTLPKFIPGEMNGNPVNVWYVLPVTFKRK